MLYNLMGLGTFGWGRQAQEEFANVNRSAVLFAFGSSLLAVALAQSKATAPPKPSPIEAPKPLAGNAGVEGTGAPVDPRTYIIGPEDLLFIRVWREPDFTGPTPVRPDGIITIPLVGDMQAGGLTPDRLSAQLTEALSAIIVKPDVTVQIQQVNSKKFYVTGEINRPGSYPLVVATRVFDALNNAGGFRDFANKKDIVIVRGDKRIKFNYSEVVKGKRLDQNIFLENGDTILVR
jgi:polysaccharide export outer membrane protein